MDFCETVLIKRGKMMSTENILYVRAHTLPVEKRKPLKENRAKVKDHQKWPRYVLVFDTETRIDLIQNLTFGVYRLCELRGGTTYECFEEGLFYADNPSDHERKVLEDYVRMHPSDVTSFPPRFPLYSHSKFIKDVFYKYAHKGAMIVCFNL